MFPEALIAVKHIYFSIINRSIYRNNRDYFRNPVSRLYHYFSALLQGEHDSLSYLKMNSLTLYYIYIYVLNIIYIAKYLILIVIFMLYC